MKAEMGGKNNTARALARGNGEFLERYSEGSRWEPRKTWKKTGRPRQMKVKLPLLSSDPGGVRKPSFHGVR
jgi:hypothetical protein